MCTRDLDWPAGGAGPCWTRRAAKPMPPSGRRAARSAPRATRSTTSGRANTWACTPRVRCLRRRRRPSAAIGGHKARRIHSLALAFIAAIARSSNVQRERANAILSAAPDGAQGQTRALVIIEGGRIVHDSLQARGRATDIVDEYRARGEDFQLFADRPEYDEASLIDLSELAAHAGKASLTRAIARHPAQRVLAWAALTAVALYGAHHRMVVMPHQRAQEARKKVEQDRTPLYLRALDEHNGKTGSSP